MKRKIFATILVLLLLLSTIPFGGAVTAAGEDITVYLSVSRHGTLVTDKTGKPMAHAPVALSGQESYSLDDLFRAAHAAYYDGADGYAASAGDWGLSVEKLWGEAGDNFGYQVGGGSETVMGLSHTVEEGDYVDAYILQSRYPDSEAYAVFDAKTVAAEATEAFTLTLREAGYDADFNMVFSPCADAVITVDGEETDFVTDAEGRAVITLTEAGTYLLSAKKSKTLRETEVSAITAPVCMVTVAPQPSADILHAIARGYAESDLEEAGGNLPWIVADMAAYEALYPESGYCLTDTQKKACADQLVADIAGAGTAGDLAKGIIALRALGYDADTVQTADGEALQPVRQLTELIDAADAGVTNVYTLPYVIIALSENEDYATEAQMTYLTETAVESKGEWQDTAFGTDAMTPMLLALAPFYGTDDAVRTAVDEAVSFLRAAQRETDGLIDGFPGYEDASTGLAICGLSALGIDAAAVTAGGKSLIDGLLSCTNAEGNGFSNAFATEQGFRGLLAWQQCLVNPDKTVYDFSDKPMAEAVAWANYCPVRFAVVPEDATVSVEGASAVGGNRFDLGAGTYTYSVSKAGFKTKTGTLEITADDAAAHTSRSISVSLSSAASSTRQIRIAVRVMIHDGDDCGNAYTYTKNASAYTALAEESITVERGSTVFDVLDAVLTENAIPYTETGYGYISEIGGLGEYDHGSLSGWQFTVDGKLSETGCRDTKLTAASTVVWYYTDDYTREEGAKKITAAPSAGGASLIIGGGTGNNAAATVPEEKPEPTAPEGVLEEEETTVPVSYPDVAATDWFYEAVQYTGKIGLMQGTEAGFLPEGAMSRAMLVTVLHRLDGEKSAGKSPFKDVPETAWYAGAVAWAAENGIVKGLSETVFAPDESVTREQMATIFYRYAAYKGYDMTPAADLSGFADAGSVSEWAQAQMAWANAVGLITGTDKMTLAPQDTATRAQTAAILMRFCESVLPE